MILLRAKSRGRGGFLLHWWTFFVSMTNPCVNSHFHDGETNIFDHRHHDDDPDLSNHDGCGARALSLQDETIQQLRLQNLRTNNHHPDHDYSNQRGRKKQLLPTSCQDLCRQCITVPVRLHLVVLEGGLVPHPTERVAPLLAGTVTAADAQLSSPRDIATMFAQNIKLLNRAYDETPFRFDWNQRWDVIQDNAAAFAAAEHKDALGEQTTRNSSDHNNDARTLHVYVAFSLMSTDAGMWLLGYSTFPSAQTTGDGVYLRYDVLAGGGRSDNHWDDGYWIVHEVGHWLGLLHTFQTYTTPQPEFYACQEQEVGLGDFVSDTPLQRGPSMQQNCRAHLRLGGNVPLPDTCPNLPGSDALFNYMNYVDDHFCWAQQGEFTCGQKERMFAHWTLFRDHVTACQNPDDDMEIELVILLDSQHSNEGRLVLASDDGGDVIYDSFSDQTYVLPLVDGPILIDHCVPRSQTYMFTAYDQAQNGFIAGGQVQIYVDRILVATIEGDFGSSQAVSIQSDSTSQPTPSLIAEVLSEAPFLASSKRPSNTPSNVPSTIPSIMPSENTNASATQTSVPTTSSSAWPNFAPSVAPSSTPTASNFPSAFPSHSPSASPSVLPSTSPSISPSISPSLSQAPSSRPSLSNIPTFTLEPSMIPSISPTNLPTALPSSVPSSGPSHQPSLSVQPSRVPTKVPSLRPTLRPSFSPSQVPSPSPSENPSREPSALPTDRPSARVVARLEESSSPAVSFAFPLLLAWLCSVLLHG